MTQAGLGADGARRRFVTVSALSAIPIGLFQSTMVLLLQARGMDLPTIGVVAVVFGLVVVALELPTGGLSDVIGRRGVLAASAVIATIALVWMALATTVWAFLVVAVLLGVARALSSGPAEAWYVDTVHAADPAAPIRSGLAQASAMSAAALAIGTMTGGAIPPAVAWLAPSLDRQRLIPLAVPMMLAALVYAVLVLIVLSRMPNPVTATRNGPHRVGQLARSIPDAVVTGTRLAVSDRTLAFLLVTVAGNGVALAAVELLTPGRLAELTGNATSAATVYAFIATVGFAANGLGSVLAPWCATALRSPQRAVTAGIVVAAGSLVALSATGRLSGTAGVVAVGVGYAGMFLGLGILGPTRSELIHARVSAANRATIISVQSLALQLAAGLGNAGLALLAFHTSVSTAWLAAGLLFLASAAFVVRLAQTSR